MEAYLNPKIFITNDGIGVIDIGEKPSECHGKGFCCDGRQCDILAYESRLTEAKKNVVMFNDQSETRALLFGQPKVVSIMFDTIHDLPTGYSVEIIRVPFISVDGRVESSEKVAILKKLPPEDSEPKPK